MNKWLIPLGVLLSIFLLLIGYRKIDPISGGKVNNDDPFAPKVFHSREIESVFAKFYLIDEAYDDYTGFFRLDGKRDQDRVSVSVDAFYQIQESLPLSFLQEVQGIIEEYSLAQYNGQDHYTSGLPDPYQPCFFETVYADGEVLSFRYDNDPNSEWGWALRDLLKSYLLDLGHKEVDYPDEFYTISSASFRFDMDGVDYHFYDEDQKLIRSSLDDIEISLPEDFFTELERAVKELDLDRFQGEDEMPNVVEEGYYEIWIQYENGRQLFGRSADISQFQLIRKELFEFLNSYFEGNEKK